MPVSTAAMLDVAKEMAMAYLKKKAGAFNAPGVFGVGRVAFSLSRVLLLSLVLMLITGVF